jgi:hypothetical protein
MGSTLALVSVRTGANDNEVFGADVVNQIVRDKFLSRTRSRPGHPCLEDRPPHMAISARPDGDYCACDLTHTATSGLSALFGANPHDTDFSLRNIAGFLLTPQ